MTSLLQYAPPSFRDSVNASALVEHRELSDKSQITSSTLFDTATLLALAVASLLLYTAQRYTKSGQLPSCPGPRRIPFLGNALQIESKHPVVQFKRWADQYGPVMSLRVFNQDIVVINSDKAAKDLLDTKGHIYSSRAPPYFAYDLMSKGKRMVFHEYGDKWRKARKIMHRLLSPTVSATSGVTQELESRQMLKELLVRGEGADAGSHFFNSFKRFSSSSIMTLCYGHRFPSDQDPSITAIFDAMDMLSRKSQPGAYLVDALPFLRHLPASLQPWRREAEELHSHEWKTWGAFLDRCKGEIASGDGRPCFIGDLLREAASMDTDAEREEAQMTDLDLGYAACALLEAGSDTTASTVASCCLAMLLNPAVQAKAHAELDRVVGPSRLPQYEDEAQLPFIRAIIKETLRWRPPTVMGVPHAVTEDDNYLGYRIPKKAMVIDNIWAMSHDPRRFPNPDKFDPESRFLGSHPGSAAEYAGKRNVEERDHFAYGHGRRICAGIHMAEKSLFQAISRILWAFSIEPEVDSTTGQPIPVRSDPHDETYTDGFVSFPREFPVRFVARSQQHKDVVLSEFANAVASWETQNLEV